MRDVLEWRRLSPDLERPLARFFEVLGDADRKSFHPHPFTADKARELCAYRGDDVYGVLVEGEVVHAYAMLRGWDEGYEVPSLGIIVGEHARGQGLAQLTMQLLHATAKRRGAKKIRLKVYPDNVRAVRLYQGCGYRFGETQNEQLVGFLELR